MKKQIKRDGIAEDVLVCIGNGESREGLALDLIKSKFAVYGCNALYRDFTPDILFSMDEGMTKEIHESRYTRKNKAVVRRLAWSPLADLFTVNWPFASGPSSVLYGCLEGYLKIYLIGHDLCNHEDGYINNVYKGTIHYLRDDAKPGENYAYFIDELYTIIRMAAGVSFVKVGQKKQLRPKEFNGLDNVSYMTTEEFMNYVR